MRGVLVLEGVHDAITAIVVGLGGHGCESGSAGLQVAQAQGLGRRKERHQSVLLVCVAGRGG